MIPNESGNLAVSLATRHASQTTVTQADSLLEHKHRCKPAWSPQMTQPAHTVQLVDYLKHGERQRRFVTVGQTARYLRL